MKLNYRKLTKSIVLGIIIFLIINKIDSYYFDYHIPTKSPILNFYFAPLLLLADIFNLIFPIFKGTLHQTLLHPHYYYFFIPKNYQDKLLYIPIFSLFIGIFWTSFLVHLYPIMNRLHKLPKFFKILSYITLILTITFLCSLLSHHFFGSWYTRVCSNCA